MENATQEQAEQRAQDGRQPQQAQADPQQAQADPQQAASARAALVDSVAKAVGWRLPAMRIYEVFLTAQLSGTIVHVQNGPVAQRWSRGLIILWFSVRIRVGPPKHQVGSLFLPTFFVSLSSMG